MRRIFWGLGLLLTISLAVPAWAAMALPVSPGGGTELTARNCPTFSWSASDGASSYRVEVYEQLTTDNLDRDTVSELQQEITERDARIERLEKALDNMERRLAFLEEPAKAVALK